MKSIKYMIVGYIYFYGKDKANERTNHLLVSDQRRHDPGNTISIHQLFIALRFL